MKGSQVLGNPKPSDARQWHEKERVIRLFQDGFSADQISNCTMLPKGRVLRYISDNCWEENKKKLKELGRTK